MSFKRLAALTALALITSTAYAQKSPTPGTHITVSKNAADGAMYSTVQAAVNAALPGQVIEILDVAEYKEQVTIDSAKHGITLRSNSPASMTKPAIIWRDTVNRSPKNSAESQVTGDGIGMSGNYETCGALRIKRAQGVTIEGIAVDGGGPAPFGWPSVWGGKDALVHGNAAITLVMAGGAVIRNCALRNAYIGIYVKDRNTGGVFANPNPADNDNTIPLSGFGKVGSHLIEYNRIHDNSLGMFFESAWDLASTVRYNLIYNNFHIKSVQDFINNSASFPSTEKNNAVSGAIMFKDVVYTPVAIYNNTFYNNYFNLIGGWKAAAPHLLFNNIFGKSSVPVAASGLNSGFGTASFMAMDMAFRYRQHNSVTSAYESIGAMGGTFYFDFDCTPPQYDTLWIDHIYVWNNYPSPERKSHDIFAPGCPTAHAENMILPGALLTGGTTGFPQDANMRWLETSKLSIESSGPGTNKTLELPDLFQSTDPANPLFLWPDWEHPLVKEYIKNKGWEAAGIRNADGKIADLGAISSDNNAQQPALARVKPTNVVLINGTTAKLNFMLSLENGAMTNPKIKFLRFVAPLPDASETTFGGSSAPMVAQSAISNITPPATPLNIGSNSLDVTLPSAITADYGFFEVIVEGTGPNGQTVTSDIGFLPYRQLGYTLEIKAFNGVTEVREVSAGEAVTLKVTAMNRGTGAQFTGAGTAPLQAEYALLSDPTARMYETPANKPLTSEPNLKTGSDYTKTYTVYFTKAGNEVISGAGFWNGAADQYIVFLGELNIKVKPGAPDRVAFLDPIPKSQLGGAVPPAIAGTYGIKVQVQDRFGNAVDTETPVTVVSSNSAIGNVDAPAASTSAADGIARFTARVTDGAAEDRFDLYASIASAGAGKASDTASLRVGVTQTTEGSPRIVTGGYVSDGGVIKSAVLTFDRDASHGWFSSVDFAFGPAKGTLTNMACVAVSPSDAKSVSISFECAFPGTNIPETMGNNSEITVNITSQYGWVPLKLTIKDGEVSVLAPTRHVPQITPKTEEATVIAPAVILAGEFTVGPNPISKRSGGVNFYRIGRQITNCELRIYDATGNIINKIKINDKALNTQAKRIVGSWDLRDKKGRLASDGTYLVRGTLKTRNGGKEKISLILSVR